MNKKQLEIYNENFLRMAKAIQLTGGDVSVVLRHHLDFFDTLAKNGIRLSLTIEIAE